MRNDKILTKYRTKDFSLVIQKHTGSQHLEPIKAMGWADAYWIGEETYKPSMYWIDDIMEESDARH